MRPRRSGIRQRGNATTPWALRLTCGHVVRWDAYDEDLERVSDGTYPCHVCPVEKQRQLLNSDSPLGRGFRQLFDRNQVQQRLCD